MDSGVGDTLREAREQRGVAIDEVAASTRIQPRLLRAIEDEDWDALPGEFYAARFITTYAQYLGLDAGAVVAEYERGAASAGSGRGGREGARRGGRAAARSGGAASGAGISGAEGREPRVEPKALGRATPGRRGGRPRRSGTGAARARGGLGPGSRAATRGSGISMRAVGAAVILAAIVAGFIVVVTGSGGGGGHHGVVTTPPAGQQAGAGKGGSGSKAGGGGKKGGAGGSPSQAHKGAELTLTTTAEVWVCLLNAKGNALIKGQILPAGEREGPFRSGGFTVALGNGAVEMEVDGKPAKTPPSSDPVGYKIGRRGGLTPLAEGERPTCA
jgi:hypothetical protein